MIKVNKIVLITVLILMKFKMVTSNKYCSLQSVTGQSRYFMCGRHEYCCTFGCCVHLAFQFYQLWYYWLLLIFMFMVCSGGSWWYRFCRQTDSSGSIRNQINNGSDTGSYYGTNHHLLHSTPTRSSNNANNGRHSNTATNDYDRRVTLVRNNGVHSYYYRNGRNSNYYDTASVRYHNGVTGDRTLRRYQQQQQQQHAHQTNFLPRLELCPYYQLYGPPPSYESVVQLSSDNLTTSCTLAEPITTVAPITNDEQQQSNCIGSTLVTPPTSTLSSSPRIIQPIVTVNLSNALSTSIEVRPICTASANLPLGETQQSQTSQSQQSHHVEVIQQQQQPIQHSIENHIMASKTSQDHNNVIKNKNQITTMEPNNDNDILRNDSILDDQKQIYENACTASNTTTTTIVPLPFRTNFIMRNEKNSIPSVCSSISTLTTVPNKYCNSEQQLQQHQSSLIQHQEPTTSTILKDFDNTQCTCSMGSSATMSTVSPSTTNNKSNKFLKSSKFNRKYYKKNSSNNSSSSSNSNISNNINNSISNNSNNINNCTISRGTNCSRISPDESTINIHNSLSNVDRSVTLDNCLVSNPNNENMMIQTTTTTDTIVTTLPMAVAIAKTPSKKH